MSIPMNSVIATVPNQSLYCHLGIGMAVGDDTLPDSRGRPPGYDGLNLCRDQAEKRREIVRERFN
jgi:hypothetical protein